MFGDDFEVKELQIRAEYAGADMETINAWVKSLPRLRRHYNAVCSRVVRAYDTLLMLLDFMGDKYRRLQQPGKWSFLEKREVKRQVKDMKSRKKMFVMDFAVSRDDTDFLLTFDTIMKMLEKYDGSEDMRLCLRSELENLEVMVRDKFGLNMAEPLDIAIFYTRHSYDEVRDLAPRARVEMVEGLNDKEFYEPIAEKMSVVEGYDKQRIINIVKRYVGMRIREDKKNK